MPKNTDVSAEDEMRNVSDCGLRGKLTDNLSVNLSKCKEIVFRRLITDH